APDQRLYVVRSNRRFSDRLFRRSTNFPRARRVRVSLSKSAVSRRTAEKWNAQKLVQQVKDLSHKPRWESLSQQKKLIYARHDKRIIIQHNKLIKTQHIKLTWRQIHACTVRKARTIFGDPGQPPEFKRDGRRTSKGSVAHPSGAPSCEWLSPAGHKGLVYPKPPG